jgi:chromosomal replication initiator protein
MLAMYLARRLTQSAYSEIGRYFGGRNHATVMSAERKIARLIDQSGCIRVAAESWPVHDVVSTLEQQILAG